MGRIETRRGKKRKKEKREKKRKEERRHEKRREEVLAFLRYSEECVYPSVILSFPFYSTLWSHLLYLSATQFFLPPNYSRSQFIFWSLTTLFLDSQSLPTLMVSCEKAVEAFKRFQVPVEGSDSFQRFKAGKPLKDH